MNNEEMNYTSSGFGLDFIDSFTGDADYIKHHGVEGMKWGEKNGPPYPLEGAGKRNFIQQKKEVIKEKKRKKMLNDPKKVIANSHLFSKEEIDEANEKFESLRKTKEHAKTLSLSRKQQRMAKDPMTLEKNIHKFSPEELDLAIANLERQNKIWDKKLDEIKKPQKTMKVVDDYLSTFSSILRNIGGGVASITNIHDDIAKISGKGLTFNDRYEVYKKKHSKDRDIFNKEITDKQLQDKFSDMSREEINDYLDELLNKSAKHSDISFSNDYLMHFGILGMKWGKKNGPPYPLNESDKSAAEKKYESNNTSDTKKSANNITRHDDGSYSYKETTYGKDAEHIAKDAIIRGSSEDTKYNRAISDDELLKCSNNAEKIVNDVFTALDKDNAITNEVNAWGITQKVTAKDFKVHHLEPSINIYPDGSERFEYYLGMWPKDSALDAQLGYHTFSISYDPKKKKAHIESVDG